MTKIFQGDFEIQAKTFYGLEEVLAQELLQLGGKKPEVRKRAVSCQGDLGFLYKVNYSSRLAISFIVPIHNYNATDDQMLYEKAKNFEWESYLSNNQTFKFDITCHSEIFTHSQYAAMRIKDGINDRARQQGLDRPQVDVENPDIIFDIRIDEDKVYISLNSSGSPLFKRNYRERAHEAPLNEVMAAGLLTLAGWDGKGNFLDPMCGGGTLLIEAAMSAMQIPSQIFRKDFAFTSWSNFDPELFGKIKEMRLAKIKEFESNIVGYDIDPRSIELARENAVSAKLDDVIILKEQDFFTSKKEYFPVLIVTNPPYNERLVIDDEDFYEKFGDTLKQNYPNTLAWLITADLEAHKKIGLRPNRKIKLYNGNLEAKFLAFETYEGSKKAKFQA